MYNLYLSFIFYHHTFVDDDIKIKMNEKSINLIRCFKGYYYLISRNERVCV